MDHVYQLQIKQILLDSVARTSNKEIVHSNVNRYDYAEFTYRVGCAANAFQHLGLEEGSTIAVMDWDSHRYLECYFAIPMIGAKLHTINVRLSPEQILYTINHAKDDLILCHVDFFPILNQIRDRITCPVKFVILHDKLTDYSTDIELEGEYESIVSDSDPIGSYPELNENTQATVFYTTGTTGEPKGVGYSHRQIVLHTLSTAAWLGTVPGAGLQRDDVYMPITPLFHVHAWGFPYLATFLGIKQVYPGRYNPEQLLKLVDEHSVTFSHCVPTILNTLLNNPKSKDLDLSNWKLIIGGSALPEGLAIAARERGIDINTGYGLSETCPMLTTTDLYASRIESSDIKFRMAAGKPTPLVQIRVVDEYMVDVKSGGNETGEIVARSPWLTKGYLKNPQASETLWQGGWMHTGDVGYFDNAGNLHITDRMKDVIKSGGEWISTLELESLISSMHGILEVAAIGVPDEKWGERPLLLVVSEGNHEDVEKQIRDQFSKAVTGGKLSKWAIPEIIEFVDHLPKTSVGKLNKKIMRATYGEKKQN